MTTQSKALNTLKQLPTSELEKKMSALDDKGRRRVTHSESVHRRRIGQVLSSRANQQTDAERREASVQQHHIRLGEMLGREHARNGVNRSERCLNDLERKGYQKGFLEGCYAIGYDIGVEHAQERVPKAECLTAVYQPGYEAGYSETIRSIGYAEGYEHASQGINHEQFYAHDVRQEAYRRGNNQWRINHGFDAISYEE